MNEQITIALVERLNLVREGLRCLLGKYPELNFVKCVSYGAELFDWLKQPKTSAPDILLMDSAAEGANGKSLYEQLHKWFPAQKVIVLSDTYTDEEACHYTMNGANGYLGKNTTVPTLMESIRRVHYFGASVDPLLANILHRNGIAGNQAQPALKRTDLRLTAHRIKVLRYMLRGMRTRQIAKELNISYKAAEHLRTEIWHVTGCEVNNFPQLMEFSFRHGLVTF